MEDFLSQAPKKFILGARGKNRTLQLPREDGTFYARSGTGAHGFIDPESNSYRKVMVKDLTDWAKLINFLDEINFLPFLFVDDAPVETADIHGLATLLKNTDKHIWVQPYSTGSIEHLIRLGSVAAGGESALAANPVISMIACSLTPRAFKMLDLEIILQSAKANLPIHACSLPGAGGTAPVTMPAVILLASAEILAMLAMAQAVAPGTPVVACPIIFSTDMRSGRSLQSSVESLEGASGAIQFLKAAFDLPTHNYGSGSDSPLVDGQAVSERTMLSTLMTLSGLDILGGAGQLEGATTVSPLQLIMDNEIFGMLRHLKRGFSLDEDQIAWGPLTETKPGAHFLMLDHTLEHCREGFTPHNFIRLPRDTWEREGRREVFDRILERYHHLMAKENQFLIEKDSERELDAIVDAADKSLAG
jgi:trimethylamine---corrinoid protein Co-methyltransferase